jgi:hypothetical protein
MDAKKGNSFLIMLAVLAMLFSSLACSLAGSLNTGKDLDINVSLKESDVNSILDRSTNRMNESDQLLKKIDRVDFQDGVIKVYGTYQRNGETKEGSYNVSLSAENGQLVAKIVDVNIEGMTVDSSQVTKINDELSKDLSKTASENQGKVEFTKVDVTDDAVNIGVKVILNNK